MLGWKKGYQMIIERYLSIFVYHIPAHSSFFQYLLYIYVFFLFQGNPLIVRAIGCEMVSWTERHRSHRYLHIFFSLHISSCLSLNNKNNNSHHRAMPQVIAWKMDSDWFFLTIAHASVSSLSRFDSSLFWIQSIFWVPSQESESTTTSDDSWSSDVFILHH